MDCKINVELHNYTIHHRFNKVNRDQIINTNKLGDVANAATNAASDAANKLGDAASAATKGMSDSLSNLSGKIPKIDLNNPLDAIPGAGLVKSAVQGLTPEEGVVPGYLSKTLTEEFITEKLEEGFEKFIDNLTKDNRDDLKKMFLDVLREQINAKFREPEGDKMFRETIINTINQSCAKHCDPDSGECKDENNEQIENELEESAPDPDSSDIPNNTTDPAILEKEQEEQKSNPEEEIQTNGEEENNQNPKEKEKEKEKDSSPKTGGKSKKRVTRKVKY